MRKFLPVIAAILTMMFCSAAYADTLQVTASILPLADWVRVVGGDRVKVSCVLGSGSSPHTFAPTPSDVRKLASADMFVTIGIGLEEWADRFVAAAAQKKLVVLKLGELIGYKNGDNPHVWLDPILAQKMVAKIADALSRLDPAGAKHYEQNAIAYTFKLQELHNRFVRELSKVKGTKLVQFHPAFSYLMKRYGLVGLAVIEPHPGKEPTAQHLRKTIQLLRKEKTKVVLVEPQLNSKAANTVAREAPAQLVVVDPLGDVTVPSRSNYLRLMEFNLNALVKAFK